VIYGSENPAHKENISGHNGFFLMLGLFLKCYEEGGRRKEELEEDQQETERRMVVQ